MVDVYGVYSMVKQQCIILIVEPRRVVCIFIVTHIYKRYKWCVVVYCFNVKGYHKLKILVIECSGFTVHKPPQVEQSCCT